MKEHHGLAKQFIRIIALAALESVLLLTVSQVVLAKGLRFWFSRTEVQQHATQKQVQELQSYVTEHHLASTDVKELTDWSHKRRYTLLELYRGQTMIYASFAPKDGMISFLPQNGTSDHNPGVLVDKTGFYDWLPCYTLTFADGEVSAMLYYNGFNTYYGTGCEILLSLCILWWFPSLFLLHCRRIVRYVVQLSEEIQAMEGGDLDHPITIRGSDEITTLASCLDSMRVTLRQQQEEEAQASAKVKNLITEMSHDLRTPLTTLLLYTEILRCRKYETPEQADNYLNKIDAKARQIKQLSDNLFEYAWSPGIPWPCWTRPHIFQPCLKSRSRKWWKRCSSAALPARWNWAMRTCCSRSAGSMCAAFWITSPPICSSMQIRTGMLSCASCRREAERGFVLKTACCRCLLPQRAPRWACPASKP